VEADAMRLEVQDAAAGRPWTNADIAIGCVETILQADI
jgi:hypothetical protein